MSPFADEMPDPALSVGRGIVEQRFDTACEGRTVPAILWRPEEVDAPTPLVLLGHGGTLHQRADYILAVARCWD